MTDAIITEGGDHVEDCPLCQAEELTERYYEDDLVWAADCLSCGVPMVVRQKHDIAPTQEERDRMQDVLTVIADEVFGADNYNIDRAMHTLPDHLHWHARPRD